MVYVVAVLVCAALMAAALDTPGGLVVGALIGGLLASIIEFKARLQRQAIALQMLTRDLARTRAELHAALQSIDERLAHAPEEIVQVADAPASEDGEAALPAEATPMPPLPQGAPTAQPAFLPIEKAPLRATSSRPSWPEQLAQQIWQWTVAYFTGGNIMVRVGVLILFFGVGFLLKFAAENVVVRLEWRYLGIVAAVAVMLGVAWRLRRTRPGYALIMQGGALGVLYLSIFSAYHLHQLLAPALAFALLLSVVVLTVALALLQNSVWLAAVAVTGGFLAPILASSGEGAHVGLFFYYLILNIGISVIALYRSWRLLNWLGLVFTFGIGALWGARFYQAEYFATTEPFLVAFFLLYTLIALLFALKQPPNLRGLVDGTLIFGTPIAFMALQSQLADNQMPNLMAITSTALGLIYLSLSWFVRHRAPLGLLREAYMVLGIAFLTLAVPLAFEGRVTSAVWAAEGAALIWVGLRQSHILPRLSGLGLMLLSGYFYVSALKPPYFHPALTA